MSQAIKPTTARKSKKSFPLTLRGDGRYQKKVAGRTHYFTGTRQEALDEWLRIKDDLYAGHDPRERTTALTLRELFNRCLTDKKNAVESGELTHKSFRDYNVICDEIKDCLGLTRTVESLDAADFSKLRRHLGRGGRSLVTLRNNIARAMVIFHYAEKYDLIEGRIKGLAAFKKPTKSDLRKERNKKRAEQGAKMFPPDEVRLMLEKASPQLRAMILLAANTGMGNTDCAKLKPCHIKDGWLDYPRPKTGIPRRAKLWQETLDAIERAGGLPFRTRHGRLWVDEQTQCNFVTRACTKLLEECGIKRPNVGFYALRHGFETVAGECKDQPAVDLVMGHDDDSMAAQYREGISDARLEAISQHVHGWLFSGVDQ